MDNGSFISQLQFFKESSWPSNRVWLSSIIVKQQAYQLGFLGNIDYSWIQFTSYNFHQRPAFYLKYQIFITNVIIQHVVKRKGIIWDNFNIWISYSQISSFHEILTISRESYDLAFPKEDIIQRNSWFSTSSSSSNIFYLSFEARPHDWLSSELVDQHQRPAL